MFLLPIDEVKPFIDEYYLSYLNNELLGFIPCSNTDTTVANYYSVETLKGSRVVPVFFVPSMLFDSQMPSEKPGPALFFMGCDDGHTGRRFDSRDEALAWIDTLPFNDFALIMEKHFEGKFPLEYHN